MIARMGKKKPTSDRHKPRWTLAIPVHYRELFRSLANANRRPITTEVLIALEAHLKAAGLWVPPPDDNES